ncbi:MAG: GGDEF domain-containing protein [Rhodoferax sp.]|nr:GGDEF domain-containing protein [Rhodoferax sp.]
MKTLLASYALEIGALLVAVASLPFSPYLALLPLAALAASLARKLHRAQRHQATLRAEIATLTRNEQWLTSQAFTDNLTGLANRLLLADRFQLTLERSKRNRAEFALLMVDLNGFKAINDTYGHGAGDHVLRTVAQRLVAAVRGSDTVARLGGDEFVLLIESFVDPDELVYLGRKLIATISSDIALPGQSSVNVGASVGFALFPRNGVDLDSLLDTADRGMYDCKVSGLMELQ